MHGNRTDPVKLSTLVSHRKAPTQAIAPRPRKTIANLNLNESSTSFFPSTDKNGINKYRS